MALRFPSQRWAEAYVGAINGNELYRKAASAWTEGAIAFVCTPQPELGLGSEQCIVLDLERGQCRSALYSEGRAALETVPFVIEADYARWTSVMKGEVEPIKAMMQNKLRLTKGHLPTIIRDVEGAKQLVASASRVDTEFLA